MKVTFNDIQFYHTKKKAVLMVLLSSEKCYWKGDKKRKTILFHGTKRYM